MKNQAGPIAALAESVEELQFTLSNLENSLINVKEMLKAMRHHILSDIEPFPAGN